MESKKVEGLDPSELYVARLEFRSNGTSNYVVPHIEYSHKFPDDYAGEFPYSFVAMRDIAILLSLQAQRMINTEVDLPEDPDELAAVTIAQAERDGQTTN
jgi:hypothetical protein